MIVQVNSKKYPRSSDIWGTRTRPILVKSKSPANQKLSCIQEIYFSNNSESPIIRKCVRMCEYSEKIEEREEFYDKALRCSLDESDDESDDDELESLGILVILDLDECLCECPERMGS